LAKLRDRRIKASEEEVASGLYGNWRDELIFILEEDLALYGVYQDKIRRCDERIEQHLKTSPPKWTLPRRRCPRHARGSVHMGMRPLSTFGVNYIG
jgi:hypothetical protein